MYSEKMPLRLYSLGKQFTIERTIEVSTIAEAKIIVAEHINKAGYKNLRTIDDADYSLRFIADPPVGRKGRNVAAIDF